MKGHQNNFKIEILLFLILFYVTMIWANPVSAGIYSIHYSSYKTLGQAESDKSRLRQLGHEAFISEADVPGRGKWYRVYTGKYQTRQKAAAVAAEMKRKQEIDKIFIHLLPQVKSNPVISDPPVKMAERTEFTTSKPSSSQLIIVGNKSSKRYHLPGMPYYSKVKKHNRILFKSEQEAITRGYYKAGTKPVVNPVVSNENKSVPQTVPQNASKKSFPVSGSNPSTAKDKATPKEAFKALIMGNEKLMPPPTGEDTEKTIEKPFKEPDEKDIVEPSSDSPIYNKALGELKERKYEQALVTFKEFISRKDTGKEWGQRALRHMADCHYYLGKQGRKENMLIAAEFYKNTLESFPDPRKENALTYYRLAKTYEHIKYYPESIKQYQNLIAKYPDSPFVPEAYFKIGEIYYTDGKYQQAAEALIRYQMKYRGGVNSKKAFYLVAHSFYKAKQSANAEVWFRDAQKKWPDLSSMPKELVLDYGLHKMSLRRFDEAIVAFSFYANLYPNDQKIKDVLMLLADAYREAGQFIPAMAVYNRLIDQYPDTKEAAESMLAMASMGMDKPGIRVFRFFNNIHYYRNPMDTYDTLIMKNAKGEIAEIAMLQKAAALVKKGQGRKAADVYLEFLRLHPESKRVADAAKGLKAVSAALIEEFYAKKDYLAVAYVYFKSYGAVTLQADEYPQVNKIALSLKELGLVDDYLNILTRYLSVAGNESIINKVSLDIADGLMIQGKHDDAQEVLNILEAKPSVKKSALLTGIRKNRAEIAYLKKQYDKAIVNYDAVVRSGQPLPEPGRIYSNYARSLREQKDNTQALQNYLTAVKYLNEEKNEKVNTGIAYKEIGDLYLRNDNLASGLDMYNKALVFASDAELKRWSQFLVGQTYMKMNQDDQAQSTFAQIKTAAGAEGFWTKVVDFYVADSIWWHKYGDSINK